MKTKVIGNWSVRQEMESSYGTAFGVYPKGERSHWARRAILYPASDGECFIITMSGLPLDARPSFEEAIDVVIARLSF